MKVRPSIRLAIFTTLGIVAYLGLAVLGAGGIAAYCSHPSAIVVAAITAAAAFATLFTLGNLSAGEREDRGNRWVIPALGLIGTAMAFVAPFTDRIDFWTLDGETTRWIGVALFALGTILRMWPVYVLGNRFSGLVAIQPGHMLVQTGIYARIRHPSYLGLLMGSFGWALTFRSGIGVLMSVLLIVPVVARIRSEEALLHAQFDGEYEAYRARTSRLIPGLY